MDKEQQGSLKPGVNRRTFLLGTAGAVPLLTHTFGTPLLAAGQEGGERLGQAAHAAGLISRQRNPDNLEFPFSTLNTFLTPNEQFYVRTHFGVPEIQTKAWKLTVEGAVSQPLQISYDELRDMPSVNVTALLECSGNSRVFLKPPQSSIRWELGGVSNAEWTGVKLADLLVRAGVQDQAVDVILEGADTGEFHDPDPKTPGVISYARSLPVQKALRPEVILAYRMNGKDLSPAHGYPVRAIVAGWYGMASVKWLSRIILTDRPFDGYFQTFMYAVWERRHGLPTLVPVSEIQVKSEIARPSLHQVIPARSHYRVVGAAWAGETEVTKVELSTDGGRSWQAGRLIDQAVPYAWRLWDYDWETPAQAGHYTLMARATDARGRSQPMAREKDRRDAMITHVLPVEVEVR